MLLIPASVYAETVEPYSNSLSIYPDLSLREFGTNEVHRLNGYVTFANYPAWNVFVTMSIENPDGSTFIKNSEIQTDKDGKYNFSIFIPQDSALGTYKVYLNATKSGYASTNTQFYFWVTDKPTLKDSTWKITKVVRDQNEFKIPYRITSGEVLNMESKDGSFFLYLDMPSEGLLDIAIPRNLIEPDLASIYDKFTALVDGNSQNYKETESECFRTFTIQLLQNSKMVEIITHPFLIGPKYKPNVPEECRDSTTYDKFSETKPIVNKISKGTKPNISEISKLPLKFYLLNTTLFYENNEWEEQTFRIPYRLYNANLEFMSYDDGRIMMAIDSKTSGTMQIVIPNTIFESEKPELLNDFLLSIDGQTSDFHRLKTNCYREFTFELPTGSNEINITHKIQEGRRTAYINPVDFPIGCTTDHNTPSSQILSGKLPSEVNCFESEMVSLKKLFEDKIICVTPKTTEILLKRNWGNYPSNLEKNQTWVELYPVLCHDDFCAIKAIWEEFYIHGKLQPTTFAGMQGYDLKTTSELIVDSYGKHGIEISDVKFEQNNAGICGTDNCLDPYTLKLLVNNDDLNKMDGYSFEIFEKYRQ